MIERETLSADSLPAFAQAYNDSFPELKFTTSEAALFINSKFPNNTVSDQRLISVIESEDGEVMSGYGVLRRSYSSPSRSLKVGLVCDVFTSAKFRKQGLFKKVSLLAIGREEAEGTDFLIGFPIRDDVMPGHLSVGWRHIFDMNIWWATPKLGKLREIRLLDSFKDLKFIESTTHIRLISDDDFLKNRFSFFTIKYFVFSTNSGSDFIIFRKAKLRNLPFTCIVYLQASDPEVAKRLVSEARKFAFMHGTLGVLGCWNATFAESLQARASGLRRSKLSQKVIVRDLREFNSSAREEDFQLSWLDSDTL